MTREPSGSRVVPERWADAAEGTATTDLACQGGRRTPTDATLDREAAAYRDPSPRGHARAVSRDIEPHGREWVKYPTGPQVDQTVKVVKNGAGGRRGIGTPRRGSTQSADLSGRADLDGPGHGYLGLGASEGRKTSREDVRV
jgi:hypothetical protein